MTSIKKTLSAAAIAGSLAAAALGFGMPLAAAQPPPPGNFHRIGAKAPRADRRASAALAAARRTPADLRAIRRALAHPSAPRLR